jgi:hypothetical protein
MYKLFLLTFNLSFEVISLYIVLVLEFQMEAFSQVIPQFLTPLNPY